jgi:DNA phosphorothioation-associated putative methyltransferase
MDLLTHRRITMTEINRGATAIPRTDASAPTRWAKGKGHIGRVVYDWGCGQGADVEFLNDCGHKVTGYDLNWAPENDPETTDFSNTDTIMCHYVLNVIETKKERNALLKAIASKGVRHVIISVRCDVEKNAQKSGWKSYRDGYLVPKNGGFTFQKNFTKEDVKAMEKILGPIVAFRKKSGGITAVFERKTV